MSLKAVAVMMPSACSGGGLDHRPHRYGHIRHEVSGFPAQLGHLADSLGREFRRRGGDKSGHALLSKLPDLSIDIAVRDLVGDRDDSAVKLVAQHVAHAGEVVLSEIIVLVEDARLGVLAAASECILRKSAPRSGSLAASPWSRGTACNRPIGRHRTPRRAAVSCFG